MIRATRACARRSSARSSACSSIRTAAGRTRSSSRTRPRRDRESTRLNSSPTEIYPLSLHDALPICYESMCQEIFGPIVSVFVYPDGGWEDALQLADSTSPRSGEHTSELQSHRDLPSFPTRRSSDLLREHVPGDLRPDRQRVRLSGRRLGGRAPARGLDLA